MARHSQGPWYRESKGVWYVWHEGRQKSLGIKGRSKRKAAVDAWHQLLAGRAVEPLAPNQPKSATTVREVLTAYLSRQRDRVKANTHRAYCDCLNPVMDTFGHEDANVVRPDDLLKWSASQGWSDSTRHNVLGAVSTAFRWAHESGVIAANPLLRLKRPPKASRGAKAVISDESFDRLHAASPPALQTLMVLLRETGARPSELARITVNEVDFENAVALIHDHKTAHVTAKPRLVFLSTVALSLLRKLSAARPTGPLLLNGRGKPWTKDGIGLAMRRASKRAGVKGIAYGFRHGFATDALARGVPDATVAALLGHSSTTMLHRHYSHLGSRAKVLRDALAQVRGPICTQSEKTPDPAVTE